MAGEECRWVGVEVEEVAIEEAEPVAAWRDYDSVIDAVDDEEVP